MRHLCFSARCVLLIAASVAMVGPVWASTCSGPPALEARLRAGKSAAVYGQLGAWFGEHAEAACAVGAFREALKLEPRSDELTVDLATAYERAGDTEQAGNTLIGAVKARPASARLTSALVVFLASHGQLDDAYRLAEHFAKLHPADPNAQKLHLRVLVATGDSAAGALARKLLAAAPADGELLYLNGVLERKAGDFEAARGHLQRSIAINPSFADSHYNLGLALQQLGDAKGAKEQMEAALSLGLGDPEAHLNLSKALRSLGETDAAEAQLKIYQGAIKSKADAEMAASKSAEAQQALDKGNVEQAISLYREALEVTPGDASLEYKLAMVLDGAGDTAGERTALEEAVRLDPGLALAQHQLGYVLSRAGDNDGAIVHFREAVRGNPEFTQAWISLAATLAMKSEFGEAREALNHALRLDPHNAEASQMKRMLPVTQASH